MKKIHLFLFAILTIFLFNGCIGTLSLAATAFSVITTSKEVEEDYDGDISDYVEDTVTETYEYIEDKLTQE